MPAEKFRMSVFAGLFSCLLSFAAAEPAEVQTADTLWKQIEQLAEEGRKAAQDGSVMPPAKAYRVRELALEFYETYPEDSRTSHLRRVLLNNNFENPFYAFFSAIDRARTDAQRRSEGRWNLQKRSRELMEIAANTDAASGDRLDSFLEFRQAIREVHPPPHEERAIYARLKGSPNATLRELAAGRERFLDLRDKPLHMKVSTADGSEMDLERLRGKVVLLDFWSLSCGSCISAMPRLQTLYEKYRGPGFEILGVFLTEQDSVKEQRSEIARAQQIMRNQGAAWPEAVMAGKSVVRDFMKQYSLEGVPELWLLDSSGRVALDVDPVADVIGPRAGEARIEREIKRLLVSQGGVLPDAADNSATRSSQVGIAAQSPVFCR